MDERTSTRLHALRLVALTALALVCAACEGPKLAPATGRFQSVEGGFSCELPGSGWQRRLDFKDSYLSIRHDDTDNALMPDIDIDEDKGRTRTELETLRAQTIEGRRDDDTFKALPIRSITIDGHSGWVVDKTAVNALAAAMHRPPGTPAFKPVLYRETTVYVTGPKKSYNITYAAPVSLYDKHRPEFDKLLASIQFER